MLQMIFIFIFAVLFGVHQAAYQEYQCAVRKGNCQSIYQSCSGGSYVSNLCPRQPANVKCCVPSGSGNCGGNCPGGCSRCPCGTTKSYLSSTQVDQICSGGPWSKSCCKCIISRESGRNSKAVNENSNGSFDVGLFQINDFNWKSCSGGSAPCSVSSNKNCAKKVFGWGRNTWKYWATCGACGCCNKA